MPYNILYLHNQSDISGGERSLLGLWTNLDRERFKPFAILPQEGLLPQEARRLGVEVALLGFPKIHPLSIISCFKTRDFLKQFCRRHAIHLVHSYGPRNNIIASWTGKSLGIPVIWHERNIPVEGETDITRRLLFLPDAVICNSHAVARRFRNSQGNIPAKAKVIHNGVDLDQFSAVAKDEHWAAKLGMDGKQVVGIVTNLSVRRRAEYFIKIAGIIHGRMPDVRFLMIGGEFAADSRGRRELMSRRIEQSGLKDVCVMTGFQNDVSKYLSLCDVVCHVTRMDACSRSVLEAMACGKAIVAVNDGGNPELVEQQTSGILVDGQDEQGYADAVTGLLQDKTLRTVFGRAARDRVEKFFDIRKNARATQDLYLELIKTKSGNRGD